MRCADKGEEGAGIDNFDYIYTVNGIFAAYPSMVVTLPALARAFNEPSFGLPDSRTGESLAMRPALPMICG